MNPFQAMRLCFLVGIVVTLFGTAKLAKMQALVTGNYVTSLHWSANGLLLVYGTGQIIPPWSGTTSEGGLARVIQLDGNIIFARDYPWGLSHVQLNYEQTMIVIQPFGEVFELGSQRLVAGTSESIAFNSVAWNPTEDILLWTGVRTARDDNPRDRNSSNIFSTRDLPADSFPVDGWMVNSIWSPNGVLAATSTTFGTIYVWNTTMLEDTLQAVFSGHNVSVQHLVWNATTGLIASGDNSGRILVWNPETGQAVRELVGHTHAIQALDWRADGVQLVSTGLDNTMRVWAWPSGEMEIVESGRLVSALAYSPDGTELAYGGEVTDPNDVSINFTPVEALIMPPITPTVITTLTPTSSP